jgi:hypothetical protein
MKKKHILITAFLFVLALFNAQAQNYDGYIKSKKSKLNFTNKKSSEHKKATNSISILNSPKFFGKKFKLEEKNKRFELHNQTFNGIEIFLADIKINFDNNNNIILYTDNTINFTKVDKGDFPNVELIESYSNIIADNIFLSKTIYFPVSESEIVPALEVQYFDENLSYIAIFNSNYDIIFNQCLSFDKDINTSKANASVFNPDPITSAHVEYGDPYFHNHGATNPSLEAEQINVKIDCKVDGNGIYYLENNFVKIENWESPNWNVVTSTNGNFNFTRDQIGFQQVNAYYHISEMKKYLNSIGFEDAVNYQIRVDADAENGDDNSHFSPLGRQGELTFGAYYLAGSKGQEHVPDAEDAEVVIHEYGHAITNSYSSATGTNERRCLEEATADYFAVSYSKAIDDYNWDKIFKWDAHNEFWDGRMATSNLCYTNIYSFPSNDYYKYSGVWTAPLMDLYGELGKETTDKLVLHTVRAYYSNTTMEQAALIMMSMDSTFNSHKNSMVIFNTFKKYCILNDSHLANDDYTMSRIKIINSKAFAQGGEMKIDFGYLFTGEIKIYDINGVNILNTKIISKKDFSFNSENLNSGIYLINISSNQSSKTVKVCKY